MTPTEGLPRLAQRAVETIEDGSVVGLGSGRAANAFARALAQRVQSGLRIRGVPTSKATEQLAASLGIPVVAPDEVERIDVDVDGADEVDPHGNLIKGRGGALVREKIVAHMARRLVILVQAEKLVATLGEHGLLPVEVVPFGAAWCGRRLLELGVGADLRQADGQPVTTDNGNYLLDCRIGRLENPLQFERSVRAIAGVVDTGLFLGLSPTVFVQDGEQIGVLQPAADR
jgi:ribose 5-phosphate isomerase A